MRHTFATIALGLACLPAFAETGAEAFCSNELTPTFRVLSVERREAAKVTLLEAHRDEVLARLKVPTEWKPERVLKDAASLPYAAYVAFVKDYLTQLEQKVDWKSGKTDLVTTLHAVIRDQDGSEVTKKELKAQVDEGSIVPLSHYLTLLEAAPEESRSYYQNFLPNACGGDALSPGGIAFSLNDRKVFAFCPGALLRASVVNNAGALSWTDAVQTEGLMFTAFHEFGHLLGADSSSGFSSMHDSVVSCLKSRIGSFTEAYEDEALADFWGAVALVAAMKGNPQLTTDQIMDRIALNLSALKNGSLFSPHHLPYGARQQVVLGEACRYLLDQKATARDCRLNLAKP